MGWDEQGWHKFERNKPTVRGFCSLCGYKKKVHLSKVAYVAHRLRHGKSSDITFADVTRVTNGFLIPGVIDNVFKSSPIFERLRGRK